MCTHTHAHTSNFHARIYYDSSTSCSEPRPDGSKHQQGNVTSYYLWSRDTHAKYSIEHQRIVYAFRAFTQCCYPECVLQYDKGSVVYRSKSNTVLVFIQSCIHMTSWYRARQCNVHAKISGVIGRGLQPQKSVGQWSIGSTHTYTPMHNIITAVHNTDTPFPS